MLRSSFAAAVAPALACLILCLAPAAATVLIRDDPGGLMDAYEQKYRRLRAAGTSVAIDGTCESACTLALSHLPASKLCVTPRARLGFHVVVRVSPFGEAAIAWARTRAMVRGLPRSVQAWIAQRGGLSTAMIYLQGRELRATVRACPRRGS